MIVLFIYKRLEHSPIYFLFLNLVL